MKERHNINLKNYLNFFGSLIELLVFCLLYYFVWKDNFIVIYSFNSLRLGKYVLVGLYFIILYCTLRFSDGLKFGQLKFTEVYVSQFVSIVATNFITFLQLSLIYSMIVPVIPIILLSGIQFFLALIFSYLFSVIYHTNLVPGDIIMIYGTDAALRFKFKADRKGKEFQITKLIKSNLDPVFIESEILKHEAVLINDVKTETRNDIIKFCFDHDMRYLIIQSQTLTTLKNTLSFATAYAICR